MLGSCWGKGHLSPAVRVDANTVTVRASGFVCYITCYITGAALRQPSKWMAQMSHPAYMHTPVFMKVKKTCVSGGEPRPPPHRAPASSWIFVLNSLDLSAGGLRENLHEAMIPSNQCTRLRTTSRWHECPARASCSLHMCMCPECKVATPSRTHMPQPQTSPPLWPRLTISPRHARR
eukprot:68000-Chlamydomonas_euryale.AAC.4